MRQSPGSVEVQGPKGYAGDMSTLLQPSVQQAGNQHCSISTEADPNAEIRTKVFRMGAPLLRSSIPISLGTPRTTITEAMMSARANRPRPQNEDDDDGSDVETVLSLSDAGQDECQGALTVTLDFPC